MKLPIDDRMAEIFEELEERFGPRNKAGYLVRKAINEYRILDHLYEPDKEIHKDKLPYSTNA